MKVVIFVCHGSICRSPAAAFIARQYLKELGRESEFDIQVRATSSEEIGNDVYPLMKRELNRRGIPLYPHRATRISRSDYDHADYIFYMDEENRWSLNRQLDDYKEGEASEILHYFSEYPFLQLPYVELGSYILENRGKNKKKK